MATMRIQITLDVAELEGLTLSVAGPQPAVLGDVPEMVRKLVARKLAVLAPTTAEDTAKVPEKKPAHVGLRKRRGK